MKRVWWVVGICILLVGVPGVFGAVSGKLLLTVNQAISFAGKNVSLVGFVGTTANFKVDGVIGSVRLNEYERVGGIGINLSGLSRTPARVIITLDADFVCGDTVCSSKEDSEICCSDCGCLRDGDACVNNRCVRNVTVQPPSVQQCTRSSECEDGNDCTNDVCAGGKCSNIVITLCRNNDRCCPVSCTYARDTDCTSVEECKTSQECDDQSVCTTDRCEGSPLRCVHRREKAGCSRGGECVAVGIRGDGTYCSLASEWVPLKAAGSVCEKSYECWGKKCWGKKCREFSSQGVLKGVFYAALGGVALLVIIYLVSLGMARKSGAIPSR